MFEYSGTWVSYGGNVGILTLIRNGNRTEWSTIIQGVIGLIWNYEHDYLLKLYDTKSYYQ